MGRRGDGEGSVYRRMDGRWTASVELGYEGGKRRRRNFYGRTRQDVASKLRAALTTQAQGLPVPSERVTVRHFVERWLTDVARPSLRPSTYESYGRICALHLLPALGHLRLTRLAPNDVQEYLNGKLASGLSPRTCQYHHAVLRRAIGQAERWGLVPRNVVRLVTPPRVEHHEIQPFNLDQARAFLKAIQGDRLEALYVLAMATGGRQGELLALTWDDLDLENGTVAIRATLQRLDGEYRRMEPKTVTSRRTLALPSAATKILRLHRTHQLEERLRAGSMWEGGAWNLVFATETGEPLSRYVVTRVYQRALTNAGLPRRRFHDLRHAAATFMLTQGVPLKVVQTILGHSQIAVTANTYAHVLPELQRDAAERIGQALWKVS